jgi:imidazolonepropionase-like amidohydrolase
MKRSFAAWLLLALALTAQQNRFTPGVKPFVISDATAFVLEHVRVVDGAGAAPREDQTIAIDHGLIVAKAPAGAQTIDLTGSTVIPGLVGMHEHLFYPSGGGIAMYNEQAFSFPRLYLAAGVTTARTAGSLEPYTDINVKRLVDKGEMPGPTLFITGPYLEGAGGFATQMHELSGPDDATRTVDYWADEGVTSFKAYMNITRAELRAAVVAAHRHHIKVTGHLCSIGFREAAEIGIDNLEHGLVVDTEFHPGKQPDVCPPQRTTWNEIAKLDSASQPVQDMIADLVKHNVAITSTLAVFEAFDGGRAKMDDSYLATLTPQARESYTGMRAQPGGYLPLVKKELEFERAFVKAGGLLMAGADPTGNGGAPAGYADQRNIELLVEGGFSFPEAIRIATFNGALFLGEQDRIGSIAVGHQADLVVLEGADIRKAKMVFKNGVPYDPAKLLTSVNNAVGLH